MAAYQALPLCNPQQPAESLPEYAARVLRHLLVTDCTATLTDEQLALAEMAAARACAQVDGRVEAEPTVAILSAARHTIALVQRFRKTLDAEATLSQAAAPPAPASYPQGGNQGGRPAPILPPPPPTRPPAQAPPPHAGMERLEIRF